ncbi:MAG: carbon-nitrogen family hydrolase [Deltaproteobacteria bacterium]|nr:carbon-nitrogen family hydrolase [Deltaproteobacteria bacterium]
MISPYQAAALQFRIDMGAVEENASRAFTLLREAARGGAGLCVLPEMWSTGFAYDRLLVLSGATKELLHDLRRLAAEKRMVIAGSLPEKVGRAVYNTLYVINATGVITGVYRKTHLFQPSGEHLHFRKGSSASVVHTDVGTVGPHICYDIRFPELSRKYFLEGATLFCVSAQWPTVRKGHWELLNTARAVENQLFVVASNAVGRSGDFHFSGGSLILSPWGERLAVAGEEEGLTQAAIDAKQLEEARRRIPCAQDRNERAYRKTRQGR